MISLFRKIRIQSISDGRTGRYLRYAVGEIFLVVIGILIAIQVNQWNQKRLQQNTITDYYEKLLLETTRLKEYTAYLSASFDTLEQQQRTTLEILNSQDLDRVDELNENIGAVATSWWSDFITPHLDELERQNLFSKIQNQDLKNHLIAYSTILKMNQDHSDYVKSQYNILIEPFFAEHINYSTAALDFYKRRLVQGGPETNYEELFQSMELYNIATLKLETTTGQIQLLDRLAIYTDSLLIDLNEELTLQSSSN